MLPNGRCSPNEMAIALHFVRLCPTRTEGQRQPSGSLGISGPAAATDTSAPLDQQRNSCPYRLASRGSHVRGVLWQVRLNRFRKDRFRCGGTRARAPASARGTDPSCVPPLRTAQGPIKIGVPYRYYAGPIFLVEFPDPRFLFSPGPMEPKLDSLKIVLLAIRNSDTECASARVRSARFIELCRGMLRQALSQPAARPERATMK
jgi:hypothetical protein